jgi:hypothetical protein
MARTIPTRAGTLPATSAAIPTSGAAMPTSSSTIPAQEAGGGGGDAFASQVDGTTGVEAWWSPYGAAAANLANTDVAMRSVGAAANPDMLATLASTGNFRVVADDIGTTASLKSCLESIQADGSNFIGIDAGGTQSSGLASYLTTQTGAFSGFCFFKNAGANWSSANYGSIIQFYGDSSTTSTSNSYNAIGFYKGTTSLGKARISAPNSLDLTGASIMAVNTWYFIAWRQTSGDSFTMYVVAVGDVWGNVQTTSGSSAHAKDGLNLGMAMGGTPGAFDGWRWGPFGLFTGDVGESALQDIFEAIQ